MNWFECVPNISVGSDPLLLVEIGEMFRGLEHSFLLHTDGGLSANRMVLTIISREDELVDMALKLMAICKDKINMFLQQGVHPRMGAIDVFPIVPSLGNTDQAVKLARTLGQRAAEELAIPGFYYEHAAYSKKNQNLANARCAYENLPERIEQEPFDFGAGLDFSRTGATAIGVRPLLLAVNFSLEKANIKLAKKIAQVVRASGDNSSPGMYQGLKAIGWYLEDYNKVQISCNVCRTELCNLFELYHKVNQLLNEKGNGISGTEIIGLVPEHILLKGNPFPGDTPAKIDFAIKHLGLSELNTFDPQDKILENQIKRYLDITLELET